MGFMALCGFKPDNVASNKEETYRTTLLAAIEQAQKEAEECNFTTWEETMESVNGTVREIHNVETANQILDDAITQARDVGVDEHLVLAIESIRPGLLDENVRMYANSVPSKTNAEKTLVALESGRNLGKFAIVAMLIAVILKIISWVINNGGKTSQDKDGDVVGVNEHVTEKASEARGKDKTGKLSGFHDAVLARLYESQEKSEGSDTDFAKLLPIADKLTAAMNAHPGLVSLITAIDSKGNKPLLVSVFEEAIKGGSDEAASAALINGLRNNGVLAIFYNPKTISALLKHPKVKNLVGPNHRMPTVSMWGQTRAALDRTVGMIDLFNKTLTKPDGTVINDLYTTVDAFLKDFILGGKVFEQPRMSDAMYESPFTQRMSEPEWSEGYMSLGNRVLTLAEAGSIGKAAMSPIYGELGKLPLAEMLDVIGVFADEARTQNGKGRFKDVIKVDTQWAKRAKMRVEDYNKTIKRLKGDEYRTVLAEFEQSVSKMGLRPTDNMRTVEGGASEPFDLLSDMAKCMRSLWETYAMLQQCADKHNNYSGLMRNFAEASTK